MGIGQKARREIIGFPVTGIEKEDGNARSLSRRIPGVALKVTINGKRDKPQGIHAKDREYESQRRAVLPGSLAGPQDLLRKFHSVRVEPQLGSGRPWEHQHVIVLFPGLVQRFIYFEPDRRVVLVPGPDLFFLRRYDPDFHPCFFERFLPAGRPDLRGGRPHFYIQWHIFTGMGEWCPSVAPPL